MERARHRRGGRAGLAVPSAQHERLQQDLVRALARVVVAEDRAGGRDRLVDALLAELFAGEELEGLEPGVTKQRSLRLGPFGVEILLEEVIVVELESLLVPATALGGGVGAACTGDAVAGP